MLRTFKRFVGFVGLLLLVFTADVKAQLQSPSQFLGYELGSEWTPHHKVMDYVRHVADQSSLVETEIYGETNEGRSLRLAYISAEENMERLEEIRTNNLKRTGLLKGEPKGDKTAIVWLSYNVHGNETSSSEAAMKTMYELVRSGNEKTQSWLQDVVVIMDPMLNPDGRDRYVHWYKETAGDEVNVHEEAREHHEPWPGGRTNHYYFDLNRDWAWLTQKESRQRIAKFQEWMPQIHVDFHEQSYEAPYYFAPAAEPFHNAITEWQRNFQHTIGKNNAHYFDKNNWLYFTGEVFDLFYPSYGDTYPIFNGAIGMTYEQGGHSRAGLGILRQEGDTLTLNDRLTHHYTTGLSTIEVSAQNAEKLVDEFQEYYQESRNNPEGKYKTYVIKADNSPDKLKALFSLLDQHQIVYGKAKRSGTFNGYSYRERKRKNVQVSKGDYLVSAYQPKSVLARVFFEPQPQLADSVTYDITAWGQHYAFGLDGFALPKRLEVAPTEAPTPKVDNATTASPYAYLARWKDKADVELLSAFLREGIKVRFSRKDFTIEGEKYKAGTLIIPRSDNSEKGSKFDGLIQNIADKYHQQLHPVATGFVQSGVDFGSSSVRHLAKPRVALLSGPGTSSNRVGEVWHYFDRQINYPLTMLNTDYFAKVSLQDYDVLILTAGNYVDFFENGQLDKIKQWVKNGGKLIALGRANRSLLNKEGFEIALKKEEADSAGQPELENFGQRQRKNISSFNTGSIYKITMDSTHPLAYGYGPSYFSLKLGTGSYEYLEDGWNVGVAKEDAHTSGFVGYKAKEKLKNTLTFGVQNMGKGSVVYMVDNPLFRAFWHNGKLLFGNAVFLVGS